MNFESKPKATHVYFSPGGTMYTDQERLRRVPLKPTHTYFSPGGTMYTDKERVKRVPQNRKTTPYKR